MPCKGCDTACGVQHEACLLLYTARHASYPTVHAVAPRPYGTVRLALYCSCQIACPLSTACPCFTASDVSPRSQSTAHLVLYSTRRIALFTRAGLPRRPVVLHTPYQLVHTPRNVTMCCTTRCITLFTVPNTVRNHLRIQQLWLSC